MPCGDVIVIEARTFRDKMAADLAGPIKLLKRLVEVIGRHLSVDLTRQYLRACTKLSVHSGASLNKHATFIKNSEFYENHRIDMEENFDLMQEVYVRLEELEVKLEIEDMARITEVEERKGKFETSLLRRSAHQGGEGRVHRAAKGATKAHGRCMRRNCD